MQKRIFYSSILILVTSITTFFICYKIIFKPIACVDGKKLFAEFKMTKELQAAGDKELKLKNEQLDSIKFLLEGSMANHSMLMQQFITKQQEVNEFKDNYTKLHSEKIWSRISTYTKDFAAVNGYEYIIDSDGENGLLYGKESNDVTIQLLNYINKKYEGFQ